MRKCESHNIPELRIELLTFRNDTSRVTLDIGLGYHVDMTVPEALISSEKRIKVLEQFVLLVDGCI
jgi:hypothetical protein